MKIPKEIVKQDVILCMMEIRGLIFLLKGRTRDLYNDFLKKSDPYKERIREIANKVPK